MEADLLAQADALHTEGRLFEDTGGVAEAGEGEDAAEEDEGDDPREQLSQTANSTSCRYGRLGPSVSTKASITIVDV